MQNTENQPEIQFTETTPNNEAYYQQQFVNNTNKQQNLEGQINSEQYLAQIQPPIDNMNPQFYKFKANTRNVKNENIDYIEQQREINYSIIPIMCYCPFCHSHQMTKITYTMGSQSWYMVFLLCLTTFVCCCLPCCCTGCQNINHFCTNCGQQVGIRLYCQRQQEPYNRNGEQFTKGEKIGNRFFLTGMIDL